MAFLRNLFCILMLAMLVFSTALQDPSNGRRLRRQRRGLGDGAQLQGSDCSGQCGGSYTPYFSGQCFMCPIGIPGPRGPPGQQGVPGRDGRDGRDAPVQLQDSEDSEEANPDRATNASASGSSGGAIYIRWGRDVCPTHAKLVYSGVAGGAFYSHKGSGSNYLCLPEEPIYDEPIAGLDNARGLVYGAEYETNTFAQWNHLHDNDVPCAVCLATSRPSLVMIPARNICPGDGWVKEYSGYLVSDYHNHDGPSEFVCMDRDPQGIPGSVHNGNGALFYTVEGRCGASGSGLPCGPYVDGYELTCAVCTK